jgi:hypothetical protein
MGGTGHDLAHALERVDLVALRVELHRQPHAVPLRDVADLAHAGRRARDVAAALVHRTHHRGAAERGGAPRLLLEHGVQTRLLGAVGPHPAEFHADTGHRQPAGPDLIQHRVGGPPRLLGALEVDPSQLHALPPRGLRDA